MVQLSARVDHQFQVLTRRLNLLRAGEDEDSDNDDVRPQGRFLDRQLVERGHPRSPEASRRIPGLDLINQASPEVNGYEAEVNTSQINPEDIKQEPETDDEDFEMVQRQQRRMDRVAMSSDEEERAQPGFSDAVEYHRR